MKKLQFKRLLFVTAVLGLMLVFTACPPRRWRGHYDWNLDRER
ncbi:hypothetical protein AGMMS49579_23650 [Spirochaetia bacterium]|nr:hypothetical protein AGMMS49579_23650 [Spirochaetia bacterium]